MVNETASEQPGLPGVSRRRFLGFCADAAVMLGLSAALAPRLARAALAEDRPPLIWLTAQDCGGCTGSLLQADHPDLAALMLRHISLDYHPTLMAGAGRQAERALKGVLATRWGEFILVVEGSIPTANGGRYCLVGGRPFQQVLQETAKGAALVVSLGSCAVWGGLPGAGADPTRAVGVGKILGERPLLHLPGCPPHPHIFLSCLLHYLTFGRLPALDDQLRPRFAYGQTLHDQCERRAHFDAGRFAVDFGDEGHRKGWCLYKLGCKGPQTHASCSELRFAGVGAWPVGSGHPCIGCTEAGVAFDTPVFALADMQRPTPPDTFARIAEPKGKGYSAGGAAVLGALAGAGAVMVGQAASELKGKRDGARKVRSRKKISASWTRKDDIS